MPLFLNSSDPGFSDAFDRFLNLKRDAEVDVDNVVSGIIADVRSRGIDAVLELTSKFDRLDLTADTVAFSSAVRSVITVTSSATGAGSTPSGA